MGSVSNGLLNCGNITAQVDGSLGCQVGACGSLAGLVDGTGLQFLNGLADCEGSQSSSLCIPLSNGIAVGNHAVSFAQLVLSLGSNSNICHQSAGSIKLNRSCNAVDDAVLDNTVVVHQNSNHSHIVLAFTGFFRSGRLAVAYVGNQCQTGLQRTLGSRRFAGCRSLRSSLYHFVGAGALGIINNRSTCTTCSQRCNHAQYQKYRDFFHGFILRSIYSIKLYHNQLNCA